AANGDERQRRRQPRDRVLREAAALGVVVARGEVLREEEERLVAPAEPLEAERDVVDGARAGREPLLGEELAQRGLVSPRRVVLPSALVVEARLSCAIRARGGRQHGDQRREEERRGGATPHRANRRAPPLAMGSIIDRRGGKI